VAFSVTGRALAQERQRCRHVRELVAVKLNLLLTKRAVGNLAALKKSSLNRCLLKGHAGVDRAHVDGDVHAAGARGAVKLHRAFLLVEAATQRGGAHVADLEVGKGVGGVDAVADGLGLGAAQGDEGQAGGDEGAFHGDSDGGLRKGVEQMRFRAGPSRKGPA
jgi:hypothetical protein